MQGSPSPAGAEATPQTQQARRLEWWLLLAAAILAVLLWSWRGKDVGPGVVFQARLSLVTADRHELNCALPKAVGRYRCAFQAPDERWPAPIAPANTLTQYLTTERRLLLVPGLFEQPSVAARYDKEPPLGRRLWQLRRFVADCKLRLVEKVPWVHVRWAARGKWDPTGAVWVAEPLECTVRER